PVGFATSFDATTVDCRRAVDAVLPRYSKHSCKQSNFVLTQKWSCVFPSGYVKSCCKLELVLLNTFTGLYVRGFCTPPKTDDNGEQQEGNEIDNVDGVGLDDGQGNKDVSDQIENEEQLDFLKKKKQPQDQPKEPNEPRKDDEDDQDQGVQMEND